LSANKSPSNKALETSGKIVLDSSKGFWRGTTKQLRIACLGFAVAAVGAALGFAVSTGEPTPVFLFAYGVVAVGIGIGFFGVMWGIVLFFRPPQRNQ
jgi:hypothetical protein